MNRRSVRWRITALATVVATVVLAIVGGVVVSVVQARLYANLDASLDQRADQIEALIVAGDAGALANRNAEDRFAQIIAADGTVVAATPNVDAVPPLIDVTDGTLDARSVTTRNDLPLEDDGYRVLLRRFDVAGKVQFVVIGENIDDLRDSINALRAVLLTLFPLAVVAIAAMVWWLVGRTLRPVEAIRREVTRIDLDQLDQRVPTPGTGDEIDRLAGTMNDMLARLETSAAQQRQFVADASHELRTPLTRLRTLLEVDVARPDAVLLTTAREALHDVSEMQVLIDDLLFLARVDAGRARRPLGPVDLDAMVEAEAAAARTDDGPTILVSAAPDHDRRETRLRSHDSCAIWLSNALRHAVATVRIAVRPAPDGRRTRRRGRRARDHPRRPRADLPPIRATRRRPRRFERRQRSRPRDRAQHHRPPRRLHHGGGQRARRRTLHRAFPTRPTIAG